MIVKDHWRTALITRQPPVNLAEIQPVCIFTIHMRLFYSVQFGSGMAMDTLSRTACLMWSCILTLLWKTIRVVHFVDRIFQLANCQYGTAASLEVCRWFWKASQMVCRVFLGFYALREGCNVNLRPHSQHCDDGPDKRSTAFKRPELTVYYKRLDY